MECLEKKRNYACLIFGCSGRGFKKKRLPHPILNPAKLAQWLALAGRLDALSDKMRAYKNMTICLKHFSPGNFMPHSKRMWPSALPDLHLPEMRSQELEVLQNGFYAVDMMEEDLCIENSTLSFKLLDSLPFIASDSDSDVYYSLFSKFHRKIEGVTKNACSSFRGRISQGNIETEIVFVPEEELTSDIQLCDLGPPIISGSFFEKPYIRDKEMVERSGPPNVRGSQKQIFNQEVLVAHHPRMNSGQQVFTPCTPKPYDMNLNIHQARDFSNFVHNYSKPSNASSMAQPSSTSDNKENESMTHRPKASGSLEKMVPKLYGQPQLWSPNDVLSTSLHSAPMEISGEGSVSHFVDVPASKLLCTSVLKNDQRKGGQEPLEAASTPKATVKWKVSSDSRNLINKDIEGSFSVNLDATPSDLQSLLPSSNHQLSPVLDDNDTNISDGDTNYPGKPSSKKSRKGSQKTITSPANSTRRIVKVLGQKSLKDFGRIKNVISKLKLQKNKSVYLLPVECEPGSKLTKDKIKNYLENMPTVNTHLKRRLLGVLDGKVRLKHVKQKPPTSKFSKIKGCTCPIHGCNRKRPRKIKPNYRVSGGLQVKVNGETAQERSDPTLFETAENVFSVTTLLSNVQDKSQIERLCQLIIESIFRLKNFNVGGTMSKIEILLAQNSFAWNTKVNETEEAPQNQENVNSYVSDLGNISSLVENTVELVSEPDLLPHLENSQIPRISDVTQVEVPSASFESVPKKPPQPRVSMNIDLSLFHDHSYMSPQFQVFEKPVYLVRLIDYNKYRPRRNRKKKSITAAEVIPKMTKKTQKELSKLREQVSRLRGVVRKKNRSMEKVNFRLKYLGEVVKEEKGLKRVKFPKFNQISDDGEGKDQISGNGEKVKRMRKKQKEIVLLTPDLEVENAVKNINGPNETPAIKKRKRRKKIVQVPDYKEGRIPEAQNSDPMNSEAFEQRFKHLYESYLENCVDVD